MKKKRTIKYDLQQIDHIQKVVRVNIVFAHFNHHQNILTQHKLENITK
eukprot:UN17803